MTKRFQWVFIKDNELELRDNGIVKRFNNERLEELLNELHKENQTLLRKNGAMEEEIECLSEENEQLKQQIGEHSIDERLLDDLYFNQVGGI